MDIMRPRVRRMILRETLRKEDPALRQARKEAREQEVETNQVLPGQEETKPADIDLSSEAKIKNETVAETAPENEVISQKPELEKNLTLEEIDKKIKFAQETGRVPGIGLEGLAYWEEQKRLYLQEQESQKRKETQEELQERLTLKDIEEKIKFAKDTGRVPGIGPEGLAYWEQQKKLFLAKQKKEEAEKKKEEKIAKEKEKAEAQERKARELQDKVDDLIIQLASKIKYLNEEILPNLKYAKDTARMLEIARLNEEKEKTEAEIKKLRSDVRELDKQLSKFGKKKK